MSKAPAFQTYAADFYMDTAGWHPYDLGCYWRLLMYEWVNGGLPTDIGQLARIAGADNKGNFVKSWSKVVGGKFTLNGGGKLVNKRMEEEREKQLKYREGQREYGKIGAQKRQKAVKATLEATLNNNDRVEQALQSSSSKTFPESSLELTLSSLLLCLIQERDPKHKTPNLQKWATHINRLIRIDNREPAEIENVIRWCQTDTFWKTNILSTSTLREKFSQLKQKMDNEKPKQSDPYAHLERL